MGYLPADARNDWLNRMNPRPLLHVLLGALGLSNSQPATSTSKLRSLVGTVFDQGNTGACTAESVCKAVRVTQLARGLAPRQGATTTAPTSCTSRPARSKWALRTRAPRSRSDYRLRMHAGRAASRASRTWG